MGPTAGSCIASRMGFSPCGLCEVASSIAMVPPTRTQELALPGLAATTRAVYADERQKEVRAPLILPRQPEERRLEKTANNKIKSLTPLFWYAVCCAKLLERGIRMSESHDRVIMCDSVFAFFLLVFLLVHGCEIPCRHSDMQVIKESHGTSQESCGRASGHDPPGLTTAHESPPKLQDRWLMMGPLSAFLDRTTEGCPPELLTEASKVFGERVVQVWGGQTPWWPRKHVYIIVTYSGKEGVFLEKDGRYVHVNAGAELLAINEILREIKFTRADFNDPQETHRFLTEVACLHRGPRLVPGSWFILNSASHWLRGEEQDETVLIRLCKDPQFTFEGNTWTVVFNVFKPDGSVDEWRVVGEHDPDARANLILASDLAPLKPPGTFSYALMP